MKVARPVLHREDMSCSGVSRRSPVTRNAVAREFVSWSHLLHLFFHEQCISSWCSNVRLERRAG